MRAVTVLVVFCPCAFILATPTAVLAGIGNAAKYGIIIRSGNALEKLSRIRRAAFDKTGTLTYGKPEVRGIRTADPSMTEEELLRITAAAEKHSEHPLGKAIVRSCRNSIPEACQGSIPEAHQGSATEARQGGIPEAEEVKITAGQGISAVVGYHSILVGKEEMMTSAGIDITPVKEAADAFASEGATVIYTAEDGRIAGVLSLSDRIREDAAGTIRKLKEAGVVPMLLTGDNASAAKHIAGQAGISEVRAGLLPEEKMAAIREYAGSDEPICMIGDGVNDAPAMTAADAGIAMGGIGSDIAIESADAVLVSDDIRRIPYLFLLTRKVMKKIRVNITASMIINITAVVLSALGILTPITGALWHNCGSVFVVVNAALLLRVRDMEDGQKS